MTASIFIYFLYPLLDYNIRSSESFYNDENEAETTDQLQSSFKKEKVPVIFATEGNTFVMFPG